MVMINKSTAPDDAVAHPGQLNYPFGSKQSPDRANSDGVILNCTGATPVQTKPLSVPKKPSDVKLP